LAGHREPILAVLIALAAVIVFYLFLNNRTAFLSSAQHGLGARVGFRPLGVWALDGSVKHRRFPALLSYAVTDHHQLNRELRKTIL